MNLHIKKKIHSIWRDYESIFIGCKGVSNTINQVVPEEYQKCMEGMKRNLKQTLEIAETAADPRTKLQARGIVNDCYKYIMDLTTNGAIVTDAIKYVTPKQEQIDTLHKLHERIEVAEEAEQEETATTTNGVF
jgi:hypothetical protein